MRWLICLVGLISSAYGSDFTTYIGGSSISQSFVVNALATDSAGNTYVTGSQATLYQPGGYVAKVDSSGNIVFNMPGYGANAIAVDPSGNVWLGGAVGQTVPPIVNPRQSNGSTFLVKMAPDGTILYGSYFGGTLGNSGVTGITTDASGNVYVTGWTDCSDFPTTAGFPASNANWSVPAYGLFAAKLDPSGQKILYSTVIAASGPCSSCFVNTPKTVGYGITVDGAGNTLVAGTTNAANLPVQTNTSGPGNFVLKINAAGNAIDYFNYLPAESGSLGTRPIAADASGNAYVVGYSQPSLSANQATAVKLNSSGALVWSTPLAGLTSSGGTALSLDGAGNVWLTRPGTVAELSEAGSVLVDSSAFPTGLTGQDIAVDQSGVVHIAGVTGLISTITPAQLAAPRAVSVVNAASNQLSGTVAPGEIVSIYGQGFGPPTPVAATPVNGSFPSSLGGVQVMVNSTAIPLLYVSGSQINAEIPSSVSEAANGIADVQVINNAATLPDFRLAVVASNFAVFTQAGGSMAVINQDGTLNKIANPAKAGSVVSIWATGFGARGVAVNGSIAAGANDYCADCQVMLGYFPTSVTETVQYAGSSPGLIDGLMQINIPVPSNWTNNGAWLSFTPTGYLSPVQFGWINISQ